MAKGKKEEKQQKETKSSSSMEIKRSQRRQQSERDRAAAVAAEGYTPKKTVESKHRCENCGNPSAEVRRGRNSLCVRCQGEPARARTRQKAREAVKGQPRALTPVSAAFAGVAQ